LNAFRHDARFSAKLVVEDELDVVQFGLLQPMIGIIPASMIYFVMPHLDDPGL
jgi:hypothetical protein